MSGPQQLGDVYLGIDVAESGVKRLPGQSPELPLIPIKGAV
jgi:hypothetical protein